MTDEELIIFAKLLLSMDIEISEAGAVFFYKNNQKCIYTKRQFIEIFLE